MIGEMFKDVRGMPKRFWEVYGLTLVLVLILALIFAADHTHVLFLLLVGIPVAVGIFGALMTAYWLGNIDGYKDKNRPRDPFEGPS